MYLIHVYTFRGLFVNGFYSFRARYLKRQVLVNNDRRNLNSALSIS